MGFSLSEIQFNLLTDIYIKKKKIIYKFGGYIYFLVDKYFI